MYILVYGGDMQSNYIKFNLILAEFSSKTAFKLNLKLTDM